MPLRYGTLCQWRVRIQKTTMVPEAADPLDVPFAYDVVCDDRAWLLAGPVKGVLEFNVLALVRSQGAPCFPGTLDSRHRAAATCVS